MENRKESEERKGGKRRTRKQKKEAEAEGKNERKVIRKIKPGINGIITIK